MLHHKMRLHVGCARPAGASAWTAQARMRPDSKAASAAGAALQAAEFTACVATARAICGAAIWALQAPLTRVAAAIDHVFAGHPVLLLYGVMICCPLLMNLAQAWVQDVYLAWGSSAAAKQGTELPSVVKAAPPERVDHSSPRGGLPAEAPFAAELTAAGSEQSPGRLQKRSSSLRPG